MHGFVHSLSGSFLNISVVCSFCVAVKRWLQSLVSKGIHLVGRNEQQILCFSPFDAINPSKSNVSLLFIYYFNYLPSPTNHTVQSE